eukprot:291756_1
MFKNASKRKHYLQDDIKDSSLLIQSFEESKTVELIDSRNVEAKNVKDLQVRPTKQMANKVPLWTWFLIIGTLCYGYIVVSDFITSLQLSSKHVVVNFLNNIDAEFTWPKNNDGGSLCDPTFELYDKARIVSSIFSLLVFSCFCACILCSTCAAKCKNSLKWSKIFGFLSALLLLPSVFVPALPAYLSSTVIHDICPYCSPQLNNIIYLFSGNIVGITCIGIVLVHILPVLFLAFIPSIIWTSYIILHEYKERQRSVDEQDTVEFIFICGSFLCPLITFIPLIAYQQLMGDPVVSILCLVFWALPIIIASFIRIKFTNSKFIYFAYFSTYCGALMSMFLYHWVEYGLPHWIVSIFSETHWMIKSIVGIVAAVCLTYVIVSDFIFTVINRLNNKNDKKQSLINY